MKLDRGVAGVLALVVLAGTGWWVASFALPMDKVPFDKWQSGLGPRLWTTWWYLGTFVLAALSFGQLIVRTASKGPRDGAWALAFSSGTISFAVAIGLFGWMGWIGHPFFWLLPLVMTFAGLPALRDALVEARNRRAREPAFTNVEMLALLFGGCCLGLLMLQVMAPDNINYDAMWYHLRAAERNSLASAIQRTPEGDVLLALPSATSWLYTWAFLAPGMVTEDKVVLALHLELAVFVGTMACIPPLVRALVPGRDRRATRVTWVALFFFPSVFIYDTGLMGGADHMVALWAGSTVLAWVQARERGDAWSWALLGIQFAGLTAKYSSLYLLIPLAPLMLGDALWRRRISGLFVAAGVGLLLTAPYWLRNWVWHHNPIPSAGWLFGNSPSNPDLAAWKAYWAQLVVLNPDASSTEHRVKATFSALVDYHQRLYGWKDMIGDQPVMGSGYFLSLVVLPLLPEKRRLFALAVLVNLGIVVWFNLSQYHFRYLTVLTPLMAAGMAATVISLWELGAPARLAVVGLTLLLVSAYADVPFRRTHRLSRGTSPVENASEFITKRGLGSNRLGMWREIAQALPPEARPVVHGIDPQLGLPRLSITDCSGWQLAINYGRWGSVAEAWRGLRQLGATHIIWTNEVEQADTVSGEAIFRALAKATVNQKVVRGMNVGELPPEAPTDQPGSHVLYVGCNGQWQTGIYSLPALATPPPPADNPWPKLVPDEVLQNDTWLAAANQERVGWVVHEEPCKLPAPPGYVSMGVQKAQPTALRFYVRQR